MNIFIELENYFSDSTDGDNQELESYNKLKQLIIEGDETDKASFEQKIRNFYIYLSNPGFISYAELIYKLATHCSEVSFGKLQEELDEALLYSEEKERAKVEQVVDDIDDTIQTLKSYIDARQTTLEELADESRAVHSSSLNPNIDLAIETSYPLSPKTRVATEGASFTTVSKTLRKQATSKIKSMGALDPKVTLEKIEIAKKLIGDLEGLKTDIENQQKEAEKLSAEDLKSVVMVLVEESIESNEDISGQAIIAGEGELGAILNNLMINYQASRKGEYHETGEESAFKMKCLRQLAVTVPFQSWKLLNKKLLNQRLHIQKKNF